MRYKMNANERKCDRPAMFAFDTNLNRVQLRCRQLSTHYRLVLLILFGI